MKAPNVAVLRRPVAPHIFLQRAMLFEIALAVIQLCHLLLFTEAILGDFMVWAIVHATAQLALAILRHAARHCDEYVFIAWKTLATLMLIALVFKLTSRMPYVQSWLSEGLLATRQSDELGGGGWTSMGSVFFYPLAILMAFGTMPRIVYRRLLFLVIMLCTIDLVALGTRNAPIFVLLFHILSIHFRFKKMHLLLMGATMAVFIALFSYSTVNRSQESAEGNFDWLVLFEFTGSAQILKINYATVAPIAKSTPALLPAIFLTHYVSHSIAELNYFVGLSTTLPLGGLYYFKDQFCGVGVCDRVESLERIESTNPRAGVYQTMWTSLILDFGWGGAIVVFSAAIAIFYVMQRLQPRQLGIGVLFFTQIIMLSPIENYLYNGLGLVQSICIFLVFLVVQIRWRIRLSAIRPALPPAKSR